MGGAAAHAAGADRALREDRRATSTARSPRAAHVVRARHSIPRTVAAPIEPRGIVVDGSTVWISAQDTYRTRAAFKHALGRDFDVILPEVGGAFGSKGTPGPEMVAVAAAAQRVGRPVKWIETRTENFLTSYQGRGMSRRRRARVRRRRADARAARPHRGRYRRLPVRQQRDAAAHRGDADVRLLHDPGRERDRRSARARTRSRPARAAAPGAPRRPRSSSGPSIRPSASSAWSSRRRNLIRSFPHQTPLGFSYDSGDYERCLDLALELVEPERGPLVGTGVAVYVERAGGQFEEARVELLADGHVVAHSAAGPHGQGHATTFAQIVADALGVEPDRVELRFDEPEGAGTFGGRTTAMGGSALLLAARELRAQARRRRAAAVARRTPASSPTTCSAPARTPRWSRSTPRPGRCSVKRIAAVDDAGTIVNHELAEGQVLGGSVHGLGASLLEEFVHDEDGQPLNANFAAYAMPSAAEVPEIRTAFVESPSPLNPLGAKGIGEGGTIGVPAALGNAVADALGGIRVDPPYTPEKLWRATSSR